MTLKVHRNRYYLITAINTFSDKGKQWHLLSGFRFRWHSTYWISLVYKVWCHMFEYPVISGDSPCICQSGTQQHVSVQEEVSQVVPVLTHIYYKPITHQLTSLWMFPHVYMIMMNSKYLSLTKICMWENISRDIQEYLSSAELDGTFALRPFIDPRQEAARETKRFLQSDAVGVIRGRVLPQVLRRTEKNVYKSIGMNEYL